MERRYSEYTVEQLRDEVADLKEKAIKAEQIGNVSEYAIYERKVQMAKAYMMNPDDFKPGETYDLDGDLGSGFKIDYMNGVFAWGKRTTLTGKVQEKQEALPISLLGKQW